MEEDAFQYKQFHKRRIEHILFFLSRYVKPGSNVGIIGYSISDIMIRRSLPECAVYNILPSMSFNDGENIPSNRILIYDINSNGNSDPDFTFDFIIFTEVLEHLFQDDSLVMSNLVKLLRDGGFLFFSVPNVSALGKLICLLKGENPYMKKSEIINGVFGGFGHIREYSFREVKNLLNNDFKIIFLEGWNDYSSIFNKLAKLLPKVYSETIFALCTKL